LIIPSPRPLRHFIPTPLRGFGLRPHPPGEPADLWDSATQRTGWGCVWCLWFSLRGCKHPRSPAGVFGGFAACLGLWPSASAGCLLIWRSVVICCLGLWPSASAACLALWRSLSLDLVKLGFFVFSTDGGYGTRFDTGHTLLIIAQKSSWGKMPDGHCRTCIKKKNRTSGVMRGGLGGQVGRLLRKDSFATGGVAAGLRVATG